MNTIAAIPTTYNGVNFRSRLEARWASFFDLLGWQWEYEPVDLDGYIPDFVLQFKQPILVEIKPAMSEDECRPAADKITTAAASWMRGQDFDARKQAEIARIEDILLKSTTVRPQGMLARIEAADKPYWNRTHEALTQDMVDASNWFAWSHLRERDAVVFGAGVFAPDRDNVRSIGVITDVGWCGSHWADAQIAECSCGFTLTSYRGYWGCTRGCARQPGSCSTKGIATGAVALWRAAGNAVQWKAPK